MLVIHGENTTQSRQALYDVVEQHKARGYDILRLEAKGLDLPTLEQHLGSSSLFGSSRLIVIEELHTLPKSQRLTALLNCLSSAAAQGQEIVLWEKRELTPTMLKPFAQAKVQHFPVTKVLFQWLDSLSGGGGEQQQKQMLKMLRQALESDGAGMCFAMLCRQLRLLLEVSEGKVSALPPFILNKARRQAKTFTIDQLLELHTQLLNIDLGQKTSTSPLSLERELELFLLKL